MHFFLMEWSCISLTSNRLKNLTSALSELIDIRDGYKECDGLTCDDGWICAQIKYLCCK